MTKEFTTEDRTAITTTVRTDLLVAVRKKLKKDYNKATISKLLDFLFKEFLEKTHNKNKEVKEESKS